MKILFKVIFTIILFSLFINLATAGNWNKSQKKGVDKNKIYKDIDWTHSFYANAGFPSNSNKYWNVRWLEEDNNKFLRFRLFNGQIGTSRSDNKRRSRAPYWERAELAIKKSYNISYYTAYEIEFKVRFVKGFTNYRETFFQYHNSVKGCATSKKPPIMLKFQDNILYMFYALNKDSTNHLTFYPEVDVTKIYNKWLKFKLIITPTKFQDIHKGGLDLTLFYEGEELWSQSMIWTSKCGKPMIKFGIYRPGNEKEILETSIVDYDYIKIKEIKN